MANQPRYRDAGIIMMIGAVLGGILGLDIAVRAFDGPPGSKDTFALSVALIVAAVVVFILGLRMLRKAK